MLTRTNVNRFIASSQVMIGDVFVIMPRQVVMFQSTCHVLGQILHDSYMHDHSACAQITNNWPSPRLYPIAHVPDALHEHYTLHGYSACA